MHRGAGQGLWNENVQAWRKKGDTSRWKASTSKVYDQKERHTPLFFFSKRSKYNGKDSLRVPRVLHRFKSANILKIKTPTRTVASRRQVSKLESTKSATSASSSGSSSLILHTTARDAHICACISPFCPPFVVSICCGGGGSSTIEGFLSFRRTRLNAYT